MLGGSMKRAFAELWWFILNTTWSVFLAFLLVAVFFASIWVAWWALNAVGAA